MSVALCWLAAGVWLSAGRRPAIRRRGVELSAPMLRGLVAAGGLLGAVVAFGASRGAVVAIGIVPLLVLLVGHLHGRPGRTSRDDAGRVPLVLDLLGSALRAGQPVPSALVAVAPLGGARLAGQLAHVGGLLRLGADPERAWASLTDPALAPVADIARRSADSGARLARGCELLAAELRDDARAAALARAHRVGVWALAPLGLCFLPAFGCLGIVPVIVGIAGDVLSGATP
jgi:pilus assembly protein TadC